MDRRDFLKTICATPLLAPFLSGSQDPTNTQLFLISERPETFLPDLLEKTASQNWKFRRSYAVLGNSPKKTALSQALKSSGWTIASSPQKARVTLSFRSLEQASPSSFTLVRAGRILDIRTKELYSLWKEINEKHPHSSSMTIATLQARQAGHSPGTAVRIYHNGHVVEEASLKKDRIQTFGTERGKVSVKIEQGKAFVLSSSCRHKICRSAPPVSFPGERIVCAPNHFLLEIRGPSPIDTIIG
jgi:hypothetical protein